MENFTGLLEQGFQDALKHAAELDLQGDLHDDFDEPNHGLPLTNTERVAESLQQYRRNQAAMDAAVRGALEYFETPDGVAHAKALQASLEHGDSDVLSRDLATQMLNSSQFADLRTSSRSIEDLEAIGVGVSLGASFIVGAFAGAEVLYEFVDDFTLGGRAWYGFSFKSGIALDGGLEVSWWFALPITGKFYGWTIDMYTPIKDVPFPVFIRFMHIFQYDEELGRPAYIGSSLQFPFGFGFPVRKLRRKHSHRGLIAGFKGHQVSHNRTPRAELSVLNEATDIASIVVETSSTLKVALKNTSGYSFGLNAGATITINMPSYFAGTDVSNMSIDLDGWTFSGGSTLLTLTLGSFTTWSKGDTISFEITNVETSGVINSGTTDVGFVSLTLDPKSSVVPIAATAQFDLVWENFSAMIQWLVVLNSDDDFTLTGPSFGTTVGYAQPNTTIVPLTTAVDGNGDAWTFGYVFDYTMSGDEAVPEIYAIMSKDNAPQIGTNVFTGLYLVNTSGISTAYYMKQSNATHLQVTATLNQSATAEGSTSAATSMSEV